MFNADREPTAQVLSSITIDTDSLRNDTAKPSRMNSTRWKSILMIGVAMTVAAGLSVFVPGKVVADGGGFTVNPSRVVRTYLQCGGDGFPSNHTVFVQQVRNPDDFNTGDLGKIGGQCGNRWFEPDDMIIPLSNVQYQQAHGKPVSMGDDKGNTYYYTRTYPQCGGSIGAMDFRPNYTVIVDEFVNPKTGDRSFSWRDVGPQPGQCGNP